MTSFEDPFQLEEEAAPPQAAAHGSRHLERLKIGLVTTIGSWAIRIIGSTLRWQIEGVEHFDDCVERLGGGVAPFWHCCVFSSIYFWRGRGIYVMVSRHTDGEYTARVIRRFGFQPARGSSTRGARRALVEMMRGLRDSVVVAFTVDGPRGPRHVAKPGAVWLASRMGRPLIPFHISAEKKWILSSWDGFEIPRPFSRMLMRMTPPHSIPRDASDEQLEEARVWLQKALDELRERGDRHWQRRGGNPPW